MSSTAILLFVFLLPHMVFSYSIHSAYYYINYPNPGHTSYITYQYNFNMTYVGSHFQLHIRNSTVFVLSIPGLKNTTVYNGTSTENGSSIDFYTIYYPVFTPVFIPFNNFTVTTYSTANLPSIPVLKFYNQEGGYAIVSAQYGFPISVYNYTSTSSSKYNMTLSLNFVKPLPNFDTKYNLFNVILTYALGNNHFKEKLYVVSPSATFSYINTVYENNTVSELVVNAKGYATIILPIGGFPFIEPSGILYVNGTQYSFAVEDEVIFGELYYRTLYGSFNNPFMATMLGHYYVIFVPDGGNITIMFSNFDQGEITSMSTQQLTKNFISDISSSIISHWEIITVGVILVIAILIYLLKIRKIKGV